MKRLERMEGPNKIRDMFQGIERHLLKECKGQEQIIDVKIGLTKT
ncbi:hypothetical protein [Methanobacterium sp. SMA-27]|nr:hypothetical protein [Methanobacterium sp. SMA-27]